MLLLSTSIHLNVNLLPLCSCLCNPSSVRKEHSVMFCGASATSDLHLKTVWSFNNISVEQADLFYKAYKNLLSSCNLKSKLDWLLQRSRTLSCSLKSVILWHRPLIQTKQRAVVFFLFFFVASTSPGICSLPLTFNRAKSHSDTNQLINICSSVAFTAKWA